MSETHSLQDEKCEPVPTRGNVSVIEIGWKTQGQQKTSRKNVSL